MYKNLEELIKVIEVLRSENGCQWDREQTHSSLRPNMLEEAYEAVDAIDNGDMKHLKEELGDVLLQVVLHAQIASESKAFDIDDVAKGIKDKLIHRHPHVFSDVKVNSTQEIVDNWEKLKNKEKSHRTSIMDGISNSQASLMSAQKISKKAVKVGFEWDCEKTLYDCVYSEIDEFKDATQGDDREHIEEEMGDILFSIVNLARWNKIDAEQALLKANKKFIKRFKKMEELATKPLQDYSYQEFDELWKQAKATFLVKR
jgi:MazG family protein